MKEKIQKLVKPKCCGYVSIMLVWLDGLASWRCDRCKKMFSTRSQP